MLHWLVPNEYLTQLIHGLWTLHSRHSTPEHFWLDRLLVDATKSSYQIFHVHILYLEK